jgi:hypothetical protein
MWLISIFLLQYIASYKKPFIPIPKTYLLFSQNIKKIEDNELSKCANITNLEINKFLQNIQKREIKEIPEIWDDGEVEWEL